MKVPSIDMASQCLEDNGLIVANIINMVGWCTIFLSVLSAIVYNLIGDTKAEVGGFVPA